MPSFKAIGLETSSWKYHKHRLANLVAEIFGEFMDLTSMLLVGRIAQSV
jgi:hypothetical protein